MAPTPAGIPMRDESRSRRVRALLCTAPLHDLQANRAVRGGIFEALDCYDLALGAIDFVVDRMGFDTGADPDELIERLCAEVAIWAPNATHEQVDNAARVINEALVRPQRGSYSAPDDPTRRPFDFALLREEPAPEGVRVAATNEAINVLVGALDTDIASAHSAADAKLASLISRRRFGEAEAAARDARIRSIQYMADVRRIIADTRLDVRRAGWGDRVPAQMDEIVGHLAPSANLLVPSPRRSTTPTISWPGMTPRWWGGRSPSARCRSVRHTPQTCTRTRISPAAGKGSGRSTSRRGLSSIGDGCSTIHACIRGRPYVAKPDELSIVATEDVVSDHRRLPLVFCAGLRRHQPGRSYGSFAGVMLS